MIFTKVFFIFPRYFPLLLIPFFIIILLLLALFGKKIQKTSIFSICFDFNFYFLSSPIYKITFDYWKIEHETTHQKFDAGILLGGMISLSSTDDHIQFNEYNDRLLNTIELFHKGVIKNIIITGASGSLSSDMKEADILKSFLTRIGIPREKIIVENQSKNTHENATFTEVNARNLKWINIHFY